MKGDNPGSEDFENSVGLNDSENSSIKIFRINNELIRL
jgi:hypothetical protein